jgi:ferredoxin
MGNDAPESRFDERDIMFARARLEPGTPDYDSYYAMRPENKSIDDRTRAKPGLLDNGSLYANPLLFAAPEASFGLTDALRDAVDGPVSSQRIELPPDEISAYLKDLARYFGALDVGITRLEPYHVYSHIGRGTGTYGEAVQIEHTFALAFTVEMDYEMVATGPKAPVILESARQYVEAARVAIQLANLLREMGYSARAHIDGNYRVIAPLVARDAGLGEIGRMGLLMTPRQGPRVRLGVVTTDAALIADERKPDPTVIDFCRLCKKCAQNCPSHSISFEDRQEIDGALRWRIDSETCFHYWNVVGTDCARCMAVCPYAHPDSLSHNLIRWGISQSGVFRRAALVLDDLFYGKKPAWKKGPDWIKDR